MVVAAPLKMKETSFKLAAVVVAATPGDERDCFHDNETGAPDACGRG
jgi:hypothetical protein